MKGIIFFIINVAVFLNVHAQSEMDMFDIARKGTVVEAQAALKQNANVFNIVNKEGFAPLILACYRGNNKVARFFVENGCDINQNSPMGSALMASIVKGNNEMISFLLLKNLDVNLVDDKGTTALMYAAMFKNSTAVQLLLQKKASKFEKDSKGKTAFEYAVFSGNEEIISLLK